jgi:Family of unknown function (DUF5709)
MSLSRSRAAAVAAAAAVVLALAGVTPAFAHDDPGQQTAAEHAAADLAGVPMDKIEQDAKAKQDRLAKATGTRPGRRSPAAQKQAAAVAAAADPGVDGAWSAVTGTPVVPVFTAMLPNGKVLMWDSVGDDAAESYPNHSFTRAAVWNPATNTYKRVDVIGYNIFCAGFAQLADGTVLVAGGNRDQALHGIRQTHLFDWRTETWRRGPDMAAERWYPSVAALANQEALILGGGPATPEVFQTNQWMRLLTGIFAPPNRLYPFLTVRPDGNVDLVGPGPQILTLNTSGAGAKVSTVERDTINRDYASFATFKPGTTMVAGGGIIDEDGQTKVPTRTTKLVQSSSPPTVTNGASMAYARRQFNLSILADGNLLATGGESSGARNSGVDLAEGYGNTADEALQGESLEQRLAQEEPDSDPYAEDGENVGGPEVGDERSGRLVAPDEGSHEDEDKDLIAEDIGIDGAAASAEEAAVHIVDDDEEEDFTPDDEQ